MKLPVEYDALDRSAKRVVREEYMRLQDDKCHYCKQPFRHLPSNKVLQANFRHSLFPAGFFQNPVHLHHSHVTGLTIGAVHARCNAYLWQFHGE